MSDPLATPTELGVFLGETVAADDPRALLLLQLAHDRCSLYVDPVPLLGKGIELAVASRAWENVTSAHQMSLGSGSVAFGSPTSSTGLGGLYVSKSEQRDLALMAGRSGAFSVSWLPAPVPPTVAPVVSNVDPDGAATGALVRVLGYGFTGTTTVTIGGTSSAFEVYNDEILVVVVPAGSAGVAPVVVTNAVGASTAYSYERA